jgi:hypothetical protein
MVIPVFAAVAGGELAFDEVLSRRRESGGCGGPVHGNGFSTCGTEPPFCDAYSAGTVLLILGSRAGECAGVRRLQKGWLPASLPKAPHKSSVFQCLYTGQTLYPV